MPAIECAYGNAAPNGRSDTRAPPSLAVDVFACIAEQPIYGGVADDHQLRLDFCVEADMPVSLHRLQQDRNQCFETLPANPVTGLPQHNQGLADRLVIEVRMCLP